MMHNIVTSILLSKLARIHSGHHLEIVSLTYRIGMYSWMKSIVNILKAIKLKQWQLSYRELAVQAHHIMTNQEAYTPKEAQSLIT
jgi:hypothetical protein